MSMQPVQDEPPLLENKAKDNFHLNGGVFVQYHQGPLPPPAEIEQYEKVCPGAAKIIMESYVKQYQHRMKIEKMEAEQQNATQKKKDELAEKQVDAKIENDKNAMNFGCMLILILIVLGFVAGWYGCNALALALLAAPLIKVILDFFNVKNGKSSES